MSLPKYWEKSLTFTTPDSIDSKGRIFVWVIDNRDMFSGKSEIASLDIFKTGLEMIYSSIVLAVMITDMDTDIVAGLLSEERIPLGYFYQSEYHLWGDQPDINDIL